MPGAAGYPKGLEMRHVEREAAAPWCHSRLKHNIQIFKKIFSALEACRALAVVSKAFKPVLASDLFWFLRHVEFSLTVLISAAKAQQGAPIKPVQF